MGESEHGWPDVLARLDRHLGRRNPSPDVVELADLMRVYDVPGLGIAVAHAEEQPWAAGFGRITAGESAPITPHTIFQACSISKHLTAYGVLRMVDSGALDLDEDIDGYLSSWHLPTTDGRRTVVTLRQLLAHTAGLSANWFPGFPPDAPLPSLSQVLRGQPPANTPPVRASMLPGSRFRYTGSHYAVLQQLLADVTGTAFEELMRELVLEPVGMTDSGFEQHLPDDRPGLAAIGHHGGGQPLHGRWRRFTELAAAGLWTTPADLVLLGREIARAAAGRSSLLSGEQATTMLTRQVPGGYGIGTQLDDSGGDLVFGHTGGNLGYTCWLFSWRAADTTVAVMTNSDRGDEVMLSVLAAARNRYRVPGTARPPTASGELTGTYRLHDGYLLEIGLADDDLVLIAPGQPAVRLRAADGRFRVPGMDCELTFGAAGELEIGQEGMLQTATRVR